MTQMRVGWTLLSLIVTTGCNANGPCTTDAPPSLIIIARSGANGLLLNELNGTVTSGLHVRPLECLEANGEDRCHVYSRAQSADIHLEREGHYPWDTTNVRLTWSESRGCITAITKQVEALMEPMPVPAEGVRGQ